MKTYRPEGAMTEGLAAFITAIPIAYRKSMVEVGSAAGESSVVFAAAIGSVFCVDPWLPEHGCEKYYKAFLQRTADLHNVTHVRLESVPASESIPDKFFDGAYIDANHKGKHPLADIEAWLPKCKYWIGGHDYKAGKFDDVVNAVHKVFPCHRVYQFSDASWLVKLYV